MEALGVWPCRAKAKRPKASVAGEAAGSAEPQFSSVLRAYWRRHGDRNLLALASEICWVPRER